MIKVGDKFVAKKGMVFVDEIGRLNTIYGFAGEEFKVETIKEVTQTCIVIASNKEYGGEFQFFLKDVEENLVQPTIHLPPADLPPPYTGPMVIRQEYWLADFSESTASINNWYDDVDDHEWQIRGLIHLSEAAAQQWIDWWKENVVKQIIGGNDELL